MSPSSRDSLPPPPPRIGSAHDSYETGGRALLSVGALVALAQPGSLIGTVLAAGWWKLTRAPSSWRWLLALAAAVTPAVLHGDILWLWPWRWVLSGSLHFQPPPASDIPRSAAVEAAAGPLLLQLALVGQRLRRRSVGGHVRQRHKDDVKRSDALSRDTRRGIRGLPSFGGPETGDAAHPAGKIRLGLDTGTRQPFDLDPAELALHVFVPGASGSGKTTALARLADGCMAVDWDVAMIDCKGTGLLSVAEQVAADHGADLVVVNPDDPHPAHGYNPCVGDGADVSNKLVGAFNFGPNAEIFKNISSHVLSVTVDAMHLAERQVTLASLIQVMQRGGLADLVASMPQDDPVRRELIRIDTLPAHDLERQGIDGMVARLRALSSGRFGRVFRTEPFVDLDAVTSRQSVIFFALPTTSAPEDVNLMGRVLAQDFKQLCGRRLRAVRNKESVRPLLLIVDEFATLGEAQQFVDLMLQAREARITLALATQFLPKEEAIRKPALQSGLLIIHRLEASDADILAAELGTHTTLDTTFSPADSPEETDRQSIRQVEVFNVHPNDIKRLTQPGRAVVRSVATERHAIIQVYRKSS